VCPCRLILISYSENINILFISPAALVGQTWSAGRISREHVLRNNGKPKKIGNSMEPLNRQTWVQLGAKVN
jgi:hypothetical protein